MLILEELQRRDPQNLVASAQLRELVKIRGPKKVKIMPPEPRRKKPREMIWPPRLQDYMSKPTSLSEIST